MEPAGRYLACLLPCTYPLKSLERCSPGLRGYRLRCAVQSTAAPQHLPVPEGLWTIRGVACSGVDCPPPLPTLSNLPRSTKLQTLRPLPLVAVLRNRNRHKARALCRSESSAEFMPWTQTTALFPYVAASLLETRKKRPTPTIYQGILP